MVPPIAVSFCSIKKTSSIVSHGFQTSIRHIFPSNSLQFLFTVPMRFSCRFSSTIATGHGPHHSSDVVFILICCCVLSYQECRLGHLASRPMICRIEPLSISVLKSFAQSSITAGYLIFYPPYHA